MNRLHRTKRLGVGLLFLAALMISAPVVLAAAGSAAPHDLLLSVAAAPPAANASASINAADLQAAQAVATAAAKNPALQNATSSLWKNAWNAIWPFITGMFDKFIGLLGNAWNTLSAHRAAAPATTNVNASVTP
jgi:hypothetical protein